LLRLTEKYGIHLVRFKGLIFDPNFDHPLLVQGSVGILYAPAHLPIRESDDFISRLVFIMAGAVNGLEEEVLSQLSQLS
jgi:hypothetical protein